MWGSSEEAARCFLVRGWPESGKLRVLPQLAGVPSRSREGIQLD